METTERARTLEQIRNEMLAAIEEYESLQNHFREPTEDEAARIAELETIIAGESLDMQTKADAYAFVRARLKAEIVEYQELAAPLLAVVDRRTKDLARLEERMESVVASLPGQKIKTPFTAATVYPIKNARLVIENENDVPFFDEQGNATPWWRRPPPQIDRAAIKMALKNGGSVPWAKLEDGQGFRWQ